MSRKPIPGTPTYSIRRPDGRIIQGQSFEKVVNEAEGQWIAGEWAPGKYIEGKFVRGHMENGQLVLPS